MKLSVPFLRWFDVGATGTPAADALVLEQLKFLTRLMPILFLVLIVNTCTIAYALPPTVGWILRLGAPAGFVIVCALCLRHWLKMKARRATPDEALRILSGTRTLTAWLCTIFSLWVIAALENVHGDTRAVLALLAFVGAVGSACCFGSLPSAARPVLLLGAVPVTLWLLVSGNALLACIGVALAVFLLLLVSVLNASHRGFRRLCASRAEIDAERQRATGAEVAARLIADRFEMTLNNMSQGVCFYDGSQRLILWNNRYIDMYDLPVDKVRAGMTLREMVDLRVAAGSFPAMTQEQYLAWRDRIVVADQPSDTVVELSNGRIVEIRHRPMPDRGWVATHEDVTERHHAQAVLAAAKADAERAEAAARKAHTRLVEALDVIPEGLVVFDAEDRYVLWNRRYAEIYQGSQDALVPGATFEEVVRVGLARGQYPDAIGREDDWLRERLALHAEPQHTHEQPLTDDRWVRIEERRTADGGRIGLRVDITDLKRREASFRLLFEENPLPMWVVDIETLEFLAVNAATCRRYGYTREQLLAMTVESFRLAQDLEELREKFRKQKGMATADVTVRHVTADGTVIDVAIEARPLRYQGRNACVAVAFDMTARKRAEDELRETREFLNAVIEHVPVTIFVKDVRDQRYALANRAAERLLGVERNELIGKTAEEFFGEETARKIARLDREAIESGEPLIHPEVEMDTRAGGTRTVNSTRVLIRSRDGNPRAVMRVIEDVTERKRAEHWIMHLASHDSLTGLPNRSAFDARFTAMLDQGRSTETRFALMCVDLDRFKEINDLFGHAVGDVVLREVSERLRGAAAGAFVARIGGDEFAVLGATCDGFDVRALAERMRSVFVDDIIAEDHVFQLGLSIGIAIFPDDGSDARTLIGNADAALYRAKQEGRGVIRFFTATMDQQLRERRALEHDLRHAIANGELALQYQPQATIDRKMMGFEALARWTHPRRGAIPPAEFIPIAEESGLIVEIGEWVLREACREAATWGEPLQVAVNVSAVQFRRGNLKNLVHAILLETGLAPNRLELEITEGVLVENVSRAAAMLRGLKALGVGIALDDFGTGYSSLSYLQSFPLDRIKIDRIFTSTLGETEGSLAIVRAVIGLAHGLRLPVLAEGVETEAQLAILRQEACDHIQGYLIGPPRPIAHYGDAVGRQTLPAPGARSA
jgi:diguanylate cyclase (GGDEF)-like protein/PAS domain S-box-containing protein